MKKLLICIVVIALLFSGCYFSDNESEGILISLSDDRILIEGKEITSDES